MKALQWCRAFQCCLRTWSTTPRASTSSGTRAMVQRKRDFSTSISAAPSRPTVRYDETVTSPRYRQRAVWHDRFMRIVSLLPSTTEILFAIGAGDDVVGVTFECDHPVEARERTIVSTSALPEGLDAAGIDAFVAAAMRAGEDLYHLDEGALSGLDADLVVTQDLCAVCAVDVSVVDDALAHLGCSAEVLTIDPHTLDGGARLGPAPSAPPPGTRAEAERAGALAAGPAGPGRRAGRRPAAGPAPRVLLLEWTDPPFAPGHWVPEMVTTAGGVPTIGAAGREVGAGDLGAGARRRPGPGGVRARAATTSTGPRASAASWSPRACCRRGCRCGPWTPTRPSRARARAWSTGSRPSRASWPMSRQRRRPAGLTPMR